MRKSLAAIACLFVSACLFGQMPKFGKVSAADFTVSSPVIDSGSSAVVLFDVGSTEFEGNSDGWFNIIHRKHKRIKILNNNGFDAATVAINLFVDGTTAETVHELTATTYSLENGVVVPVKMESKSVFENKVSRKNIEKKFTMPSVKAGCIIEYSYKIKSPFIISLQPWEFQGQYPVLMSQYQVSIPDFFGYVFLTQGFTSKAERKDSRRSENFTVRNNRTAAQTQTYSLTSQVSDVIWTVKDAPALKEESFTTTLNNHITKIEFQLAQYRFPEEPVEEVLGSWPKVAEKMLARSDFGASYLRGNGWLDDELKVIVKGAVTPQEKAKKIFEYVRDNFTCNSNYGIYLDDGVTVKDVFKKKSGRVSEINLLLLAMLRHESIKANPVLVSLRARGKAHPVYPLMDRFNYLVAEITFADGSLAYLDASQPMLGFNQLPLSCYSGVAWMIAEKPEMVELTTDSLREDKITSLTIINSDKGLKASVTSILGERESYSMRQRMVKSSKEELLKEIGKGLSAEIKASNLELESMKSYEEPVKILYDLDLDFNNEDVIYFNPLLGEAMKKNPFTSAKRFYPVEMPYQINETYVMSMEVPKGYVIDEVPKSVRMKLNENEGMFEYIFAKSADKVQMRCRMNITKANFSEEDYDSLREFFTVIINKQSEQIVFKKVK